MDIRCGPAQDGGATGYSRPGAACRQWRLSGRLRSTEL